MVHLNEYPSGDKVVVNPDQIRLIRPMNNGHTSKIFFANDQYVTVNVTIDSVVELLKGKPAKTEKKD
jgi:hypothetical protein